MTCCAEAREPVAANFNPPVFNSLTCLLPSVINILPASFVPPSKSDGNKSVYALPPSICTDDATPPTSVPAPT